MRIRGDCAEHEPDLSALLDGELEPAREREIRRHVEACGPCARDLARLGAVSGVLRRWESAETRAVATPVFRRRVLQRIGGEPVDGAEAGDGAEGGATDEPTPAGRVLLMRSAAAAVVLVGLGAGAALALSARRPANPLDVADLRAEIERVRTEARDAVARIENAPTRAERIPLDVQPLETWQSVVAWPDDGGDDIGAPETPGYQPQWEEHGDRRIVQDTYADFDRFHRDRRELALTAEWRRLAAAAALNVPDRTTAAAPASAPLGTFLAALDVAEASRPYKEIQVFAITRPGRAADFVTPLMTAEALRLRGLRATESGDGGSVVLENRDLGGRPVLVIAGDVLAGGGRDRVAAEDVLLAPGQRRSVRTRTSGRAHKRRSKTFRHSDGVAPLRVRALLATEAPQSEIDAAVAASLPWLGSAGGRGSLDDLFGNDQLISRADRYVRALTPRLGGDDVVGFAVAAGGELLGIEVFGDATTFQAASDRVLRSYVLEVLSRGSVRGSPPSREDVVAALAAARIAADAGGGRDGGLVTFVSPEAGLLGRALVENGRVQHAVLLTDAALPAGGGAITEPRGAAEGASVDLGEGGDTEPPDGPGRGATDTGGGIGGDR